MRRTNDDRSSRAGSFASPGHRLSSQPQLERTGYNSHNRTMQGKTTTNAQTTKELFSKDELNGQIKNYFQGKVVGMSEQEWDNIV